MERTEHEDGFDIEFARGRAFLRRPAPGVIHVQVEGMATAEFVPDVAEFLEREIAVAGKLRFFVDAADLLTYTPEYRSAWTQWLREHREQLGEVHMLVRSRIVQLGIDVVNPLIGDFLVGHSTRAEFDQALADAVAAS